MYITWIIVMFLQLFWQSFWWHPFTAENPLVKMHPNLSWWRNLECLEGEYIFTFHFWLNHSLKFFICFGITLIIFFGANVAGQGISSSMQSKVWREYILKLIVILCFRKEEVEASSCCWDLGTFLLCCGEERSLYCCQGGILCMKSYAVCCFNQGAITEQMSSKCKHHRHMIAYFLLGYI